MFITPVFVIDGKLIIENRYATQSQNNTIGLKEFIKSTFIHVNRVKCKLKLIMQFNWRIIYVNITAQDINKAIYVHKYIHCINSH